MIPVPGVYMLKHRANRAYVGSSMNVERRCTEHVQALNAGCHPVATLQADWLRDGPAAFYITLLEPLDPDGARLDQAERRWAARLRESGITLYGVVDGGRGDMQYPRPTLPSLRMWRLTAALSQRALATRAGIAASTVARIEQGGDVHPSTMWKLAEALNCQPVDLMERQA